MNLKLKTRYLLVYILSPSFTGFIVGIVILISPPWESGLLKSLLINISAVFGLSFLALIFFFIPALYVGWLLYDFKDKSKVYQLVLSIGVGFIVPFTFVFVLTGLNADLIGFSLAADILGTITSFIVTLKLIYYPLKENRKLE